MTNLFSILPVFLLAMLLFWQKRKFNFFIMLHVVIAIALYARGFGLYPSDFGDIDREYHNFLFDHLYALTLNFTVCFSVFWLYQWWYIGRRRSELNGE